MSVLSQLLADNFRLDKTVLMHVIACCEHCNQVLEQMPGTNVLVLQEFMLNQSTTFTVNWHVYVQFFEPFLPLIWALAVVKLPTPVQYQHGCQASCPTWRALPDVHRYVILTSLS